MKDHMFFIPSLNTGILSKFSIRPLEPTVKLDKTAALCLNHDASAQAKRFRSP